MSNKIFSYANGTVTIPSNGNNYRAYLGVLSATNESAEVFFSIKKNDTFVLTASYNVAPTATQKVNETENNITITGEVSVYNGGSFNIYQFTGNLTLENGDIISFENEILGFTQ